MPRINYAAIVDAEAIWDDPGKEMKVRAIYDGFKDSFLPTWIRFPTLAVKEENLFLYSQELVMGSFGPQDFSC